VRRQRARPLFLLYASLARNARGFQADAFPSRSSACGPVRTPGFAAAGMTGACMSAARAAHGRSVFSVCGAVSTGALRRPPPVSSVAAWPHQSVRSSVVPRASHCPSTTRSARRHRRFLGAPARRGCDRPMIAAAAASVRMQPRPTGRAGRRFPLRLDSLKQAQRGSSTSFAQRGRRVSRASARRYQMTAGQTSATSLNAAV